MLVEVEKGLKDLPQIHLHDCARHSGKKKFIDFFYYIIKIF